MNNEQITVTEEHVGKLATELGIESLPKDSKFRIDDKGIIRVKKQMLSDAELNMMDAKAYLMYVIEQHEKNTSSRIRLEKIAEAKEFILNNMEETPLNLFNSVPVITQNENGWSISVTNSGMVSRIENKPSKNILIAEWNENVRNIMG